VTGTELPEIVMDEAGNTGENLLDPDQPIYALAALRMDDEKVHRAVGEALGRTRMTELKWMRRSGRASSVANDRSPLGSLAQDGTAGQPVGTPCCRTR
jgi:hypothetical protein